MMESKRIWLLALILSLSVMVYSDQELIQFPQINIRYQVQEFIYQQNSFKIVLQVFHKRHFKNSPNFQRLQRVLSQMYTNYGEYINILYTDCEKDTKLQLLSCQMMSKSQDNHHLIVNVPGGDFKRMGKLLIQGPPTARRLSLRSDFYYEQELIDSLNPLCPDLFMKLKNLQEYEDFLLPKYSPKFILFIQQDGQIPTIFKKISSANFLHLDFGLVSDLTEEIVQKLNVTQFPSFLIIKYNFDTQEYEYIRFDGSISEQNFKQVNSLVKESGLQKPRNDHVFHKIAMQTKSQILTVNGSKQFEKIKQRLDGWVIIEHSNGEVSERLLEFQKKYDRFFSYVNYIHEPVGQMFIYSSQSEQKYPLNSNKIPFKTLYPQDFFTNSSLWMSKDFAVLGVRQKYAHICGLAEKNLFKGYVQCLIVKEVAEPSMIREMDKLFKFGHILAYPRISQKGPRQEDIKGETFKSPDFQQVYKNVEFVAKWKLRQNLDQFMENPVSQVKADMMVEEACLHPTKKCLILVANLFKKDRTLQQYIKDELFDHLNSFIVYEVDESFNRQFVKAIGGMNGKKAELIVYNPRTHEFTRLNKKMTKTAITQFLKDNAKSDKNLILQKSEKLSKIKLQKTKQVVVDPDDPDFQL